ncbi:RsiW-degrading membrane proteinase PrsW (M82 family) [Motilibacter rhizosphaerae]|uniref:RsiW-degrading membrane proteinase PrsW (M82 family) n=1 Tax=Motilibacter rhizosphaerae TaxID=598652 RepID=A0A4Q7NUY7_9ACTN|nr:PrsW family glutamic-type intramembrane protease [Motilibacter rhizosphaerae]RZS91031.1 RsiW-degrading membrane proteinase PrsW (M82 family) [Motilibacter rhizosphaerae]
MSGLLHDRLTKGDRLEVLRGPGTRGFPLVRHRDTSPLLHRHAWVVALAAGALLYLIVERALVDTGNVNFVPSLILLGALVVPVAFVTFVHGRSATWSVSLPVLLVAAVFGGVVGTVTAGLFEYDTVRKLGVLPTLGIGLIEESAKLVVPLLLLMLGTRIAGRSNGLMVGVTVGMAFAALETMGYAFTALLQTQGDLGAVDQVLLLRGLLSPAGHAAWTGLACAALYRRPVEPRYSLWRFVATFALVVVLHGLWDSRSDWWWYLGVGAVSLGLLALEARRGLREPART